MFESVNIRSSVALYVQIENQVQFAVASGRLKAGDRLPSVREMAEKLKTNFNTIEKSYRDLAITGIVYSRRAKGVFINSGIEKRCRENCRRRIVARIHEVVAEAKAAGMKPQEVKDICAKSFGFDTGPYGETPEALLALATTKKS